MVNIFCAERAHLIYFFFKMFIFLLKSLAFSPVA